MASTNKTTYYDLSQYVGNDKPTYLTDYNQDMGKIDTGIHNAQGKANTNETNIGTLSNLVTTDKTNLVGAINEVNSGVSTNKTNIGTLSNLATIDKTDIVNAINEVNSGVSTNKTNIGTLPNLATIDKTDIVNAINEVNSKAGIPVGSITMYAGNIAPNGYLICNGAEVSRETYADLFSVIGITYGAGNDKTTFNLPNLKGRVPVGLDSNDTDFDALGETGGEKTHTLTIDEIPSHTHNMWDRNWAVNTGSPDTNVAANYLAQQTPTSASGGGQAHNNLQPYIVLNYIIKF